MDENIKPPVPINDFNSYPNASLSAKKNEKDIPKAKPKQEAVVSSDHVKIKKQSAWRKAKHRIFEQEGKEIKDYVVNDVVIPAAKETLWTAVSNGLEILLYGESRHSTRRPGGLLGGQRYGNYVSYNSISNNRVNSVGNRPGLGAGASIRNNLALDDFIFQSRGEALDILDRMSTILTDYGIVTVADLYDMCGLKTPYTYNNYAWRDLSTAGVSLTRDGYLLSLPTPQVLD